MPRQPRCPTAFFSPSPFCKPRQPADDPHLAGRRRRGLVTEPGDPPRLSFEPHQRGTGGRRFGRSLSPGVALGPSLARYYGGEGGRRVGWPVPPFGSVTTGVARR